MHVEPGRAVGDHAAEAHEQQVVEVVEPPLVERAEVEAGHTRRELTYLLQVGLASEEAEQAPAEDHADGRHSHADEDEHAVDAEDGVRLVLDPQGLEGGVEDRLQPLADGRVTEGQAEDGTRDDGQAGQQDERHGHAPRRLVDLRLHGGVDVALAVERLAHQPEHVEGGHERDHDTDEPDPLEAQLECLAQDLVLGEEAGQRRDAGDGERADEHRPVGDGDLVAQGTHLVHVLLAVDGVDDGARAQEQQALEEAVGHEMEDGGDQGAHAQRREHVAQLGQRGVGQHALDVLLGERDGRGEDGREDADRGDQDERLWCMGEDGAAAGDEVDAGVDHRGGVDEGADRRRALHRVRQPDVERELGALAHGAAEQQQADADHHPRLDLAQLELLRQEREDLGEVQRADRGPDGHDAQREAEVADAVDQERLLGGQGRAALAVPEADEQVARQAHQLPGREQQQVVRRQHQQQHAEHEEVEVGEEAPPAGVVGHVADGVDVDQHADRGDHDQHHRGQVVEEQLKGMLEVARRDPLVEREVDGLVAEGTATSAW